MPEALPRSFYDRRPEIVAQELLGKILVRKVEGHTLTGRIVETEAYLSAGDEASHSFKGKNKRNISLYKEAGHAYVHAMRHYFLLDIVTEGLEVPSAVLIRALEPLEGIAYMKEKRGVEELKDIASGPSKLCMALGITREFDGIDMTTADAPFYILKSKEDSGITIEASGRIGISKATDAPLRFWVKGSPYVSRK